MNDIPTAKTHISSALPEEQILEFKRQFDEFMDRSEPDCYCDIKALAGTTGHDINCVYMAWKKMRR